MALTPAPITWKTLPKSVFSTSRAKAIWRPIPQRMMRSLMARLWAEKSQAMARIVARPSSPVKRCISGPLVLVGQASTPAGGGRTGPEGPGIVGPAALGGGAATREPGPKARGEWTGHEPDRRPGGLPDI